MSYSGLEGTRWLHYFRISLSNLLLHVVFRRSGEDKKGPIEECSKRRGIMTSSCIGKVYGRALRKRLLPAALNFAADTQCGGFPGRSPEFASHCARLFAARCKARSWSHATVFLDATSAFYSLLRQWVLGFNETEDCLRQLCAKVGIPNADEMISMASRYPILVDAGASRESVALARDWHTGNWISEEHVEEKRFCAKGTRPGDVLADLVFNIAMSWVITQARSKVPLHEVPVSSSALPFPALDDSGAVSCSDVSFVDDFALLVATSSPTDLLDSVRKHVCAYSELFAVCGLSLNMSPGKTEAFVTFRGQGAKDAASKLVQQDNHSHVPLHDGKLLRVVRSYVHVCTLTTPSGSYAQEVSRRTQSMLHAYLPLAKSTFGDPSFPIRTRLDLAESLLFTRLTFALVSWDLSFERKVASRTELCARSLESVPLMSLFGAIVCCMLPKPVSVTRATSKCGWSDDSLD